MSKRPRKENFSGPENLFLSDKYEEFKEVIDAKHKDANTNRKKKEAWDMILQQHQARFSIERSLTDLKGKLGKLKTEGREVLLAQKKAKKATGGGKPPKEPSPAQQKILDLCADAPGFKGLNGESGPPIHVDQEGETQMAPDENLGDDDDIEDARGDPDVKTEPSSSTSAQKETPAEKKAKQQESFGALIDIERSNALLKQENLLLKQQKLKLEIALLQQQLGPTHPASEEPSGPICLAL